MAVVAVQLGVDTEPDPPQLLTLARLRFLAVVRGGRHEKTVEQRVTEIPLSALEAPDGGADEAALRDEGDCFYESERSITMQPLRDFIQELTPCERELVLLIFWTELSQAEVARRRGWHPMKVHRQLQSVLDRARERLASHRNDLVAA